MTPQVLLPRAATGCAALVAIVLGVAACDQTDTEMQPQTPVDLTFTTSGQVPTATSAQPAANATPPSQGAQAPQPGQTPPTPQEPAATADAGDPLR